MRLLLFIITLIGLLETTSHAQKFRVLDNNPDFEKVRTVEKFDYIHDDLDSSKFTWVATYEISLDTVFHGEIEDIFTQLKTKANRLGANSFRVDDSDIFIKGRGKKFIKVSVFWLRMEDRGENLSLFKSNKLYLFGFLGYHVELPGYSIKFGDEDMLMKALTFFETEIIPEDEVEIRFGSKSRGDRTTVKHQEGKLPTYLYFRKMTGQYQNSFIRSYDWYFGEFLLRILEKA